MAQKEADSGYVKRIGNAALNIKKTRGLYYKIFTAVIYRFRNKLECLSLASLYSSV